MDPDRHSQKSGAPSPNKVWLKALEVSARLTADPDQTLPRRLDALALLHGDAPALLSDEACLSYAALAGRVRQYARCALAMGLDRGSSIALLMAAQPDYVALWLGFTRVGVIVTLLNPELPGPALAHGLETVRPSHLILDQALASAFAAARPYLRQDLAVLGYGGGPTQRIDLMADAQPAEDLPPEAAAQGRLSDIALQIFTSGTTGLPKAARISHRRILAWSGWFAGMMATTPADRLYNCLPLHHSVGGVVAIGGLLVNGGSVVIRPKFSASAFWPDVVRWRCTLFQYIGELCRYLTLAPPVPEETQHSLRLACGNGLRADVWPKFQTRFGVPQILEFYASTEGNFSLYNVEGREGSIGRIPPFLSHRFALALVAHDVKTASPLRDANGRCVRCDADEVGEAIGRIDQREGSPGAFEGYTDADQSEAKILRNVFEANDAWFRSGDLMRKDRQGFFYFVDRVGDTFRWKGENVSTAEVAAAVLACPGVRAAAVYGVAVPGAEGRAGIAALEVDPVFDLDAAVAVLKPRLPPFALPRFLRLTQALAATQTFKLKTEALREDGFDPSRTSDPLYVLDLAAGRYCRIDDEVFKAVNDGRWRL